MHHARIGALVLILAIAGLGILLVTPAGRAQTPSIDIINVDGDAVFDVETGNFAIPPPTGEVQIEFGAPGAPNPDFAATNVNGTIVFERDNGGDFVSLPTAQLGTAQAGELRARIVRTGSLGNITWRVEIEFFELPDGSLLTVLLSVFDVSGDPANSADSAAPLAFLIMTQPPESGRPDLRLVKTDGGGALTSGGSVLYTLFITNNGTATATGVTVVDDVPFEMTFLSAGSTPGWDCPDGAVGGRCTISIPDLAPNQSTSVRIVIGHLRGLSTFSVSNSANVSHNGSDPTPLNNEDSEETPVRSAGERSPDPNYAADVTVAKVADTNVVEPGGGLHFTITVRNDGTAPAENVELEETSRMVWSFHPRQTQAGNHACGTKSRAARPASATSEASRRARSGRSKWCSKKAPPSPE